MGMRFHSARLVVIALVLLFGAGRLQAELPIPRFDRLTPLGCSAGGQVEVQVLGNDCEELKALVFDHPGITATPVAGKEKLFLVSVAASTPEGSFDARLIGKWGVSNPRQFSVTHGLTDLAEKEPNNDSAAAQPIGVNVALNGQSDGNDQDVFRLTLKKGQRVTIDCRSSRLDVQLDAVLRLQTPDGKQLASSGDYYGRDPFLDLIAPADGDYDVVLHDLSYRGGLPYRLVISDRPHVENAFPRAVQIGKTTAVKLLGRNLAPRLPAPDGQVSSPFDPRLEEVAFDLTPPENAKLGDYQFLEHPTAHSVAPTAATGTLSGFQFRPGALGSDGKGVSLSAVTMLLTDLAPVDEQEPNDALEQPQGISLPVVLNGRFDRQRDADWYEFSVPENGQYGVDVYCERIAGQADPYLVLVDETGNRFQELDDFGHRINAFDGHLRDPSGSVNLSAGKKYRLLVQDRYRRGGPRYQYVLSVRKQEPDFFVAAMHHHNPGPGGTTLRAGGAAFFDLIVHQKDGYNGPVVISASQLPPGVHFRPTSVHNTHGSFVLWADADAALYDGPIELIATGKRGEQTLVHAVRPYARVWNDNPASSRPQRQSFLSVRDKAPFALEFAPGEVTIEAGKKAEVKVSLKRLWPDFTAQVTLQAYAFPGQVKATLPQIAAGASEATLTFEVQPNAAAGEYTLTILGQAQVPFTKDPAKDKANTLVTLPSRPLNLTVTPAVK